MHAKAHNKPTVNPLAGATTEKNSVIWLNKIDRASFENVIVDSIIAKEAGLAKAGQTWDAGGEHVDWDFGAVNKGCVVYFEVGQSPDQWLQKQGVEVLIKQGTPVVVDNPVYVVVHMEKKLI